jgi:hypothetical protein
VADGTRAAPGTFTTPPETAAEIYLRVHNGPTAARKYLAKLHKALTRPTDGKARWFAEVEAILIAEEQAQEMVEDQQG